MGLKVGNKIPRFEIKTNLAICSKVKIMWVKSLWCFIFIQKTIPLDAPRRKPASSRTAMRNSPSLGAEVIGISADSEQSHRSFASKYDLPFILLADTQKKVRRMFKVENSLLRTSPEGKPMLWMAKER